MSLSLKVKINSYQFDPFQSLDTKSSNSNKKEKKTPHDIIVASVKVKNRKKYFLPRSF